MILHGTTFRESDGKARLSARFEVAGDERELWFEVEERFGPGLDRRLLDGFLVALLPLAMERGEPVEVRGPVSERLLFHLRHGYQDVISTAISRFRPVEIRAESAADPGAPREAGVGTGFAGGVDSFSLIRDHLVREPGPGARLTHLVFNNVGSHDPWPPRGPEHDGGQRLFRAREARVRGYAAEAGLEWVGVDSNLSLVDPRYFPEVCTLRNQAVALLLPGVLGRYLVAGSYHHADCHLRPHVNVTASDPFSVPLLTTPGMDFAVSGCQYPRAEKAGHLLEVPGATRYLNVCVHQLGDGGNCGRCMKCTRTLLTLEILGAADDFVGVFDMEAWRSVRDGSLVKLYRNRGGVFEEEILELARRRGLRPGSWHRLAAALLGPRFLYDLAHRAVTWTRGDPGAG